MSSFKRTATATNPPSAKRTRFTRPGRRGAKGTRATSGFIAKIAQQVVDRNVEQKFFDQSANVAVDDDGGVSCLSFVPQGDTDQSRDGDHLRASSLRVRQKLSLTSDTPCMIRVVYLQWLGDTTNSPPTVAAVLEQTQVLSMLSHDFRSRMKIMSDKTYSLDNVSSFARIDEFDIKIPNRQFNYAGATTQHTWGIWRIVLSNIAAISNPPNLNVHTRFNYTDA